MSAVKHESALHTSCVWCLITEDAVRNLHCDISRTSPEMKLLRNFVHSQGTQPSSRRSSHIFCTTRQTGKDTEQALEILSLSSCSSFLEINGFWNIEGITDIYYPLTYESLHNDSLGISKILKDWILTYIPSEPAAAGWRKYLYWACNLLLRAIRIGSATETINVKFLNEHLNHSMITIEPDAWWKDKTFTSWIPCSHS